MPIQLRQPHRCSVRRTVSGKSSGFTLIELMIVLAIIAIILTLALPVYSVYSIRAKIGEALGVSAAAKTSTGSTCIENPELTDLTNEKAGYTFTSSTWIESITITGDCTEPVISALTWNTGAEIPPTIILTGNLDDGDSKMTWDCTSTAPNYYLPRECRSSD